MRINNYVSLKNIMWKILKHSLANEITYEEVAEYTLECLKLMGAPVIFENKLATIELEMHKGLLPCDIITIDGIRYLDTSGDHEHTLNRWIALREATNIYHLDANEHKNEQHTDFELKHNHNRMEFTYTINNGVLFTSPKEGCVEIAYKGIVTDEDGYPMIPDNEKVSLAIEYYVLNRYLEPLWLLGKISDKAFEYITQKRYFYAASSFTGLQMPSVDGLASIMNSVNRLILSTTSHETFFKKAGEKERIRKYR